MRAASSLASVSGAVPARRDDRHHLAADLPLQLRRRPLRHDPPTVEENQPVAAPGLLDEVGGRGARSCRPRAARPGCARGRGGRRGRGRWRARPGAAPGGGGGAPWRSRRAAAGRRRGPPPAPSAGRRSPAAPGRRRSARQLSPGQAVEVPLVAQVLLDRQVEVEARATGRPLPGAGGPRRPGREASASTIRTLAVRRAAAGSRGAEEGRLAAAVGAQEAEQRAGGDREAHAVQGHALPRSARHRRAAGLVDPDGGVGHLPLGRDQPRRRSASMIPSRPGR